MIGRGTRLCRDLFGPDEDKQDFRVFDFCFNFDFFDEHPQGIESSASVPLGARLFQSRVRLLGYLQTNATLNSESGLRSSLEDGLHRHVSSMNRENFLVRMRTEAVERFQERAAWGQLSDSDRETLQREIAGLPSEQATEEIESRLFDLVILRMQIALVEEENTAFEKGRQRVMEMAAILQEKAAIPVVAKELGYLDSLQERGFWEGMNLSVLEDLRLRLRGLMPFLDKKKRKVVYTDFKDEIMQVREREVVYVPKMTGVQYEKKVKEYLREHLNSFVLHRLRTNQPLTETDLQGLETTLVEIGEEDGESLLSGWLKRSGAPSLAYFVRGLVGMDRAAAQAAFSEYLSDRSLTSQQIRFVEMVIEQLTAHGVMEASALYDSPFIHLHTSGPDELFAGKKKVIDGIFAKLRMLHDGLLAKAS